MDNRDYSIIIFSMVALNIFICVLFYIFVMKKDSLTKYDYVGDILRAIPMEKENFDSNVSPTKFLKNTVKFISNKSKNINNISSYLEKVTGVFSKVNKALKNINISDI